MKKVLCITLIGLLLLGLTSVAFAVPKLSENMFDYAKATLSCLASGSYDKIVTSLPFSDVSPSADEWARFARRQFLRSFRNRAADALCRRLLVGACVEGCRAGQRAQRFER